MEYLFLHFENKDRYFNNLEIFIIWIHCIPFPPVGGTITKTNPSFGEKYLFALHRCIVKFILLPIKEIFLIAKKY